MIKYQNSKIDQALKHFEAAISSLRAGVQLIADWEEVVSDDDVQRVPVYSSLEAICAEILRRKEADFAPVSLPSTRQ